MGGIALKNDYRGFPFVCWCCSPRRGCCFPRLPRRIHLLTRRTLKHRLSTRLTGLRIIFRPIISFLIITLQSQKRRPSAGLHQRESGRRRSGEKHRRRHLLKQGRQTPAKSGRTWREADINYTSGFRNSDRILYSSDWLIYKTTDHYKTFTKMR